MASNLGLGKSVIFASEDGRFVAIQRGVFLAFRKFYFLKARMAEWLRRATQVRVEKSAWVRPPLLALSLLVLIKTSWHWCDLRDKEGFGF